MASTQKGGAAQSGLTTTFWQEVKELDKLTDFFSWFFMLLTRLSEPFMLLSTLYVIAETGVPAIASPAVHDLAIGIMITAPEVILPGAFVVAKKVREQEQKLAGLLHVICWLFVVLTLATLADLFIFHFSGGALAVLMYARCAVSVGYSIVMRVMSHGQSERAVNDFSEQITAASEQIEARFSEKIREVSEQISLFTERLNAFTPRAETEMYSEKMQEFSVALEGLKGLPAVIESLSKKVHSEKVVKSENSQSERPALSLVHSEHSVNGQPDKKAFVHSCLSENPSVKNSEIQRRASETGLNISPAHISQIRKAYEDSRRAG